jgi:DNA-binding transcriptional LysR family regulator
MQFEYMKEFYVLANTLNFLSASEQLYMSQATLSKHIHEMEEELGAPLFDRTTRKVSLTDLGILLYPYAKRSMALQDEYTAAVNRLFEDKRNTIAIGYISRWREQELTDTMSDFQLQNPELHIVSYVNDPDVLLSQLSAGNFNFIFSRAPESVDYTSIVLSSEQLCAYIPQSHPLANEKLISLTQLADEPFIMEPKTSLSYKLGVEACKEAGFTPNILFSGNRMQVMSYLDRGLGVSLMFGPSGSPNRKTNRVPIIEDVKSSISMIYKNHQLTEPEKKFIDFLKSRYPT